jgi:hypothetical protein
MTHPGQLDTSADAQRVLDEGSRRMSAAHRAQLMNAWSHDVRELAFAGVRQRFPDATAAEQLVELGRTLYGDEVVSVKVVDALHRRMRQRTG